MTTTSQLFDNPADIQLHDLSAGDESDEESREDEIKKLLEEGLSNETFDYDSDEASISKFSNHNDCSFISNKDESFRNNGNNHNNGIVNGRDNDEEEEEHGIFQTPKLPNGAGIIPNPKRVDFSELPNIIPANDGQRNNYGNGNGNGIHINGMGEPHSTPIIRSNLKMNGNSREQQSNRETEEIEVQSPTISLLHKDHCPQTENESGNNGIWLSSAENNVEQLKVMLEMRERQIQRDQATLAALQKDKRALHHQIQLMKTDMVDMRSRCDEAEKFAQMKEEQVIYLKSKITEGIEEFEQARKSESVAKTECNRLNVEIDKLHQEIQMLSALGASTQQAELSDVVRQRDEKHARDIASWRTLVADLEGQLRTYKRSQQLMHVNDTTAKKESVETQTEFRFEEEIERREKELAVREFQEEFGGCAEQFLDQIKDLPDKEIVKRVRHEWKIGREKLINHYEGEIKIYQRKLAELPKELYGMWQQTQEELGLNKPPQIIKITRNASTLTEQTHFSEHSTSFSASMLDAQDQIDTGKDFKEEAVQVNLAALMANGKDAAPTAAVENGNNIVDSQIAILPETTAMTKASTSLDEKETSSVIVQTDETLETYKILAGLIDNWSREVGNSKQRAEIAESKAAAAEEELKGLNKKFRQLQKLAITLRKESKKREDTLRSQNATMKAHYLEMLQKLNDRLAVVDQIDLS